MTCMVPFFSGWSTEALYGPDYPQFGWIPSPSYVLRRHRVLENIRATLETHGYGLRDVVKCTVMLADIAEWAAFNNVYRTFFSPPYPARSALGANGPALGARVEVECIAARP